MKKSKPQNKTKPQIKSAMLMAAGLGTRLKPYTEKIPKAFMPVLGVPAIQFAVERLLAAGVKEIVVNIHHLPELSRDLLKKTDFGKAKLLISDESDELLGSAGGILKGTSLMSQDRFFLLNADVLFSIDLKKLAHRHFDLNKKHGVEMTLSVHPKGFPDGKYAQVSWEKSGERITKVATPEDLKSNVPFYLGAAVMEKAALQTVPRAGPSDFSKWILQPAVSRNKVGVFQSKNYWSDIGSPELWVETHFSLMKFLKSKSSPPRWKKYILHNSHEFRTGIWKLREIEKKYSKKWKAPCFAGDPIETPESFGPFEISYPEVRLKKIP